MNNNKRKDYILVVLILIGFILINSGIKMNMFVIAQNSGMPVVNWNGVTSNPMASYHNASESTKYVFLADRQNWLGFSIGDFVMYSGSFIFIFVTCYLYLRKASQEQEKEE